MLERAQHFIVTSIQDFENKTRTDRNVSLAHGDPLEGFVHAIIQILHTYTLHSYFEYYIETSICVGRKQ